MAGFDFGVIGAIIGSVMDTDVMDIGRAETKTNPNGSTGMTDPKTPKYTGIPCHISLNTIDNPDPVSVGSMPIITTLTLNCAANVDLQNGDYVTARKLSAAGDVLAVYTGVIGAPAVSQGRKQAMIEVRKGA